MNDGEGVAFLAVPDERALRSPAASYRGGVVDARPPRRGLSDAEYLARYEREVWRYVGRHGPAPHRIAAGPGETNLSSGYWAWLRDDGDTVGRWLRYAREHRGLKAMNPDGSWRAWEPRGAR